MRLATVRTPDGDTHAAVQSSTSGTAGPWLSLAAADLSELLRHADWREVVQSPGPPVDGHPVNPLPSPGKVVCCGLNYADHIAELGRERPSYPTLFAKFADTLTGPDEVIEVPTHVDLDWEAELAVVVGGELRWATLAQARASIAGYTVANDFSVRDWQARTLQWFQGKVWDATTPLGPVVVTPDELDPEVGVAVTCEVNGTQVQHGNTRTLVFGAAALLAYISQLTTLRPGDIVLTGTPGGVGMGMTPPRFLVDGDVVRTCVAGIGALENTIRTIPRPAGAQA